MTSWRALRVGWGLAMVLWGCAEQGGGPQEAQPGEDAPGNGAPGDGGGLLPGDGASLDVGGGELDVGMADALEDRAADVLRPADASAPRDGGGSGGGEDAGEGDTGRGDGIVGGDVAVGAECGNGAVEALEACDDGNTTGGDWCSPDCSALVDMTQLMHYPVRRTWELLPFSDGLWAGVVDARQGQARLAVLTEHVYAAYDQGQPTRDVLWDAYFGFAPGPISKEAWLPSAPVDASGLVEGTGIAWIRQHKDGLELTTYYFAPFHHPDGGSPESRIVVGILRVVNLGAEPLAEASAFSLLNFHMGGEGNAQQELVVAGKGPEVLVESKANARAVYRNLVPAVATYTADAGGQAHNPWVRVQQGEGYADHLPAGPLDDVVVGFQNQLGAPLVANEAAWFGFAAAYARQDGVDVQALESALGAFVAGRGPEEILQAEQAWWDDWHGVESFAPELGPSQRALARQSTAVLKMGQCRETEAMGCPSGKCQGQLLASLPPGQWNIAWVRDAAYAIAGLVASGHGVEAREALRFFLDAEMRQHPDGGNFYQRTYIEGTSSAAGVWGMGEDLGADYGISFTRYWGRGLEESDTNAAGPNIEWDNWGLFLWALGEYVEATQDDGFALEAWPVASTRTADLLLALVEPDTGLLRPDSSIWERHWCPHGQCSEPETRKHFTYSCVAAARGLHAAAALAARVGDMQRAVVYQEASAALGQAIRDALVVTVPSTGLPALAGNLEELPFETYYLDLAAVEAITWGILHAGSIEAFGTMAAFDAHLRVGEHSPGYIRNDDPTWYDRQEWVVMDLRAAAALARMGQSGKAKTLVDWVADQAQANALVMAELFSNGVYEVGTEDDHFEPFQDPGGDYQGAIPMVGFGAGAYLLALEALALSP